MRTRIRIKIKTNRPAKSKKPLIIGIVGRRGSGKDTVAHYIAQKYNGKDILLSDYIDRILKIFHLPASRQNTCWLITKTRERFGKGILARAVIGQVDSNGFAVYLINGIRLKRETEILRERFGKFFILLSVVCENKIRLGRIKKREKEKFLRKDKINVSLKKFLEQEKKLVTEKEIPWLEKRANYTVENNTGKKDLFEKINHLAKILKL